MEIYRFEEIIIAPITFAAGGGGIIQFSVYSNGKQNNHNI